MLRVFTQQTPVKTKRNLTGAELGGQQGELSHPVLLNYKPHQKEEMEEKETLQADIVLATLLPSRRKEGRFLPALATAQSVRDCHNSIDEKP